MATDGFGYAPVPASTRLLAARDSRTATDYHFDFWTALGWTLLTCGFYSFYVSYKLIERVVQHNRRRLALLTAANEMAWARAQEQGREAELRPNFERVAGDLAAMERQTTDFREPWIWLVLLLVGGGIVQFILYWLLDGDLIKHEAAERDAEHQLAGILGALGMSVEGFGSGWPPPAPKAPHNYVGRIVATIFTCGIYSFWWLYDLMVEGNAHFARDAAFEDALVLAVR